MSVSKIYVNEEKSGYSNIFDQSTICIKVGYNSFTLYHIRSVKIKDHFTHYVMLIHLKDQNG